MTNQHHTFGKSLDFNLERHQILYLFSWPFCHPRMWFLTSRLSFILFYFIFNIFIDYAITVVPFSPLHSTPSCTPPPSHIPPYSSCPWVILKSSLAATFPTLFLPFPCLFSTYHLCYLFSIPLPPSPPPTPLLTTLMF